LRGETQQLVAGDLQGFFAALVDRLAPLFASDPGLAAAWIGVAVMLFVYALFFAPAGQTARSRAAAEPARQSPRPQLSRR